MKINLLKRNLTKSEWAICNAHRQLSEVQQRGVLHQFYPSQLLSCYKNYMGTCRIKRRVFSFLFEVKIIKTEGVIPCTHFQRAIFLTFVNVLRILLWFLYLHLERIYPDTLQQKLWKILRMEQVIACAKIWAFWAKKWSTAWIAWILKTAVKVNLDHGPTYKSQAKLVHFLAFIIASSQTNCLKVCSCY